MDLSMKRSLLEAGHVDQFAVHRDGSVDFNGNPVLIYRVSRLKAVRCTPGMAPLTSMGILFEAEYWKLESMPFHSGLAYYGIATNLVSYLTKKLHEGNVSAARNVTTWQGTCYLTPLIGAVLADAYWGRYWTIAAFSTIYFIGMCTLSLSASIPALKPAECVGSICPSATPAQYAVFFFGLYLIALGTGGIKPCVSSFGADQFDDTDPKERDNAGWGLGFGIPALFMGLAIGTFHKRHLEVPDSTLLKLVTSTLPLKEVGNWSTVMSAWIKLPVSDAETKSGDFSNSWRLCTVTQVEELKILIRMFPVWATELCSLLFMPKCRLCGTRDDDGYKDWIIVPIARKFTGKERGFSELQRMGIGLFISFLCMSAAAVVEIRRLQLAEELDLVDKQLEFFYDQSPDAMRSLCSALSLLTTALGNYLSSFILTVVTYFTTKGGQVGWIPDNLNEGHLDYFFWLLAALSLLNLSVYTVCASRYKQKKASKFLLIWREIQL
ncbi:Protein NRT1/ PTR FAMILY 8.3 [Hibiscus syriacus]|uniref:Protein NRT1/ PTR FAMILY 8.3 n=1 Tax=Hibiscus syriacus TaxID=106335 RepID=A0A6A2ZJ05_HIBSY|nr:Protein NRT1/ PTR FAMILY 8.3 [Hibiscus syriacus]